MIFFKLGLKKSKKQKKRKREKKKPRYKVRNSNRLIFPKRSGGKIFPLRAPRAKTMNINDRITGQKCGRSALALWEEIKRAVGNGSETSLDKWALARRWRISIRTIKNWERALERAGAIKFKFSGRIYVNPDAYYTGDDLAVAKQKYADFNGD